jgi:hypothetical protein
MLGKKTDGSVGKFEDFETHFRIKFHDAPLGCTHIMLRDELTQKFSHFDKITVFGCPRACRFRKYQI